MDIIKIVSSVFCVFLLTACQPQTVNHTAQQQHYICKSLIEGFLKTQQLGSYELQHLQPTLNQTAETRYYSYRAGRDHNIKINIPLQQDLEFECLQSSAQHFEIRLSHPTRHDQLPLLSLNLPPKQTIETLTAFSVKTP